MKLATIVVVARNWAIGKNGDLLCHLPADLKHFKTVTSGYTVLMGRKTFNSLPKGALPNRRNLIVSRNANYTANGAEVFPSIETALASCGENEKCFVIGGAQIYSATLAMVDTLYLTLVDAEFADADTFFPTINFDEWEEIESEKHLADDRNPYNYKFLTLHRKQSIK